jgi:hypothetical protein
MFEREFRGHPNEIERIIIFSTNLGISWKSVARHRKTHCVPAW